MVTFRKAIGALCLVSALAAATLAAAPAGQQPAGQQPVGPAGVDPRTAEEIAKQNNMPPGVLPEGRDEIIRRGSFVGHTPEIMSDGNIPNVMFGRAVNWRGLTNGDTPQAGKRWFVSLVYRPGGKASETLRADFLKSPALQAWAKPDNDAKSWAVYREFALGSPEQLAFTKNINLRGTPTVILQPPTSGDYGPTTRVAMHVVGYSRGPDNLGNYLRDSIKDHILITRVGFTQGAGSADWKNSDAKAIGDTDDGPLAPVQAGLLDLNYRSGIVAAGPIAATDTPPDDSHKWHLSAIYLRGHPMSERLLEDVRNDRELQRWVNPQDPQESWWHYSEYCYSQDSLNLYRWRQINLPDTREQDRWPVILVQPSRNWAAGDPATVVMQRNGYDGDPKKLSQLIENKVRLYLQSVRADTGTRAATPDGAIRFVSEAPAAPDAKPTAGPTTAPAEKPAGKSEARPLRPPWNPDSPDDEEDRPLRPDRRPDRRPNRPSPEDVIPPSDSDHDGGGSSGPFGWFAVLGWLVTGAAGVMLLMLVVAVGFLIVKKLIIAQLKTP